MDKFVNRQVEMSELNDLLATGDSQLVALYGRRRAGKTTLITRWMQQARSWAACYWVARREPPEAVRQSLARAVWTWAYPDLADPEPPIFPNWELLFRELARLVSQQPTILVFDEFPYALESDPSLASHLQAAWDQLFKSLPVILLLSGSHIGMMVDLNQYSAPLYGRFTVEMPVDPLPFGALREFFPRYEADERLGVYACLGGVPAYLERFNPELPLDENIRDHLFRRSGMFRNEPTVLVADLVRETRVYEAILRAVAAEQHTVTGIARALQTETSALSPYLARLVDLRLLERRIPATVPLVQRKKSRQTRYHLKDSFLRFHFRFIEHNLETIEMGNPQALWGRIKSQFNAFIGATAFEEVCREWVRQQGGQADWPWLDLVGSHWSAGEQIDVVGINWAERFLVLGECKWVDDGVAREAVEKFLENSLAAVPGKGWTVERLFFARRGLAPAAHDAARRAGIRMVVMEEIDAALSA